MLVPAGEGEITEVTRSKAGGIEQNELQKFIKEYFAIIDSGAGQSEVIILFALQLSLSLCEWLISLCRIGHSTRLSGSHMPT